jgi:putative membrane protein
MAKKLVLCVDRDDDLGKKAKLRGLVIGEKDCLKAAQALAVADPTDSDVNAIYFAVKTLRDLQKQGEDAQVAVVAGHADRGYRADKLVVERLEKIIASEGAKEVVFVSDGADDEQILPLIQSRVKVSSVKTVIVKQAKELEKSYYVIKEVIRDPYFARLVFGLPGIVLLIWGAVHLLGIQQISLNLVAALVGVYLLVKGFGLEDPIVRGFSTFTRTASVEQASFPLYVAAIIVLLLSLWSGVENIGFTWKNVPAGVTVQQAYSNLVTGSAFLAGFAGLFTAATILFLIGRMGDMYFNKKFFETRRYARMTISTVAAFVIIDAVSRFVLFWTNATAAGPTLTDLFISVGIAFFITLIGFLVIRFFYTTKYVQRNISRGLDVKDAEGNVIGKIASIDYRNKQFVAGKETVPFSKVLEFRQGFAIVSR